MKIPVNLSQGSFLSVECIPQALHEGSRLLMSNHGVAKEQLVPFLYLVNNPQIEVKGFSNVPERKVVFQPGDDEGFESTISIKGIAFVLVSSEKKILLAFEQFADKFSRDYEFRNSNYYIFQAVERPDILQYEKIGNVKFHAVNPKTSDTLHRNSRRGAHGLIAGAMLKGITNLTGKLESDLKEHEGVKYKLSFLLNGGPAAIEVVAEKEYEAEFDTYLSMHWTTTEPQIQVAEPKGGCYIATACYQSYDHPSVMVLRNFRDEVLVKNSLGRLFVKVYYKYSPFWANQLKTFTTVNKLVRVLLLDPVVKMVAVKTKK